MGALIDRLVPAHRRDEALSLHVAITTHLLAGAGAMYGAGYLAGRQDATAASSAQRAITEALRELQVLEPPVMH